MRRPKRRRSKSAALFAGVVGWNLTSCPPQVARLKSHRHGIGLRDDGRDEARRMNWYFCGERTGRREKEMIVELSSFRVKGDASQGENIARCANAEVLEAELWSA
jgi:hypothetical protein